MSLLINDEVEKATFPLTALVGVTGRAGLVWTELLNLTEGTTVPRVMSTLNRVPKVKRAFLNMRPVEAIVNDPFINIRAAEASEPAQLRRALGVAML